jgi:hypothetical protein|tara:strand:- start:755 stop:871 length:117 start_codon:yes stop_codon:yes gene_type:complete
VKYLWEENVCVDEQIKYEIVGGGYQLKLTFVHYGKKPI